MEGRLGGRTCRAVRWWRAAVAAGFPCACASCGREGSPLCAACERVVLGESRGGAFVVRGAVELPGWAFGRYGDPVLRRLLRWWKYDGVVEAGEGLARLLAAGLQRDFVAPHAARRVAVVPVPLHPWKRAWRGFDQAEALASVVAAGLPVTRALGRRHRWKAQASIADAAARAKNALGTYTVRDPRAVCGRDVLLVDDVCTTGSTAMACAQALHAAGAASVTMVVFLRK
jgi:ComF family protein